MVSAITLASGLAATAMGVVTIGVMLYFALLGQRSDRHLPAID